MPPFDCGRGVRFTALSLHPDLLDFHGPTNARQGLPADNLSWRVTVMMFFAHLGVGQLNCPQIELGSELIGSQPEDDSCGDADCREVGMGATVVSGVDASPVLEPPEHVLDYCGAVCRARGRGGSGLCGWILRGCWRRFCGSRAPRGTNRRHSPCRREATWL